MAKENGSGAKEINLQYKVPVITWVRLRLYAKRNGLFMGKACEQALERGLTELGVPRNSGVLLGDREDSDV